jgi:hypothetical protein
MRAIKSKSLLLAACRLMLVARSLMLAACCLNRLVLEACCLRLEAWCLWLAAQNLHTLQSLWCYIDGGPLYPLSHLWPELLRLVLAICYILNVWIPTRSTITASVVLIWSGARPAACHHRGCMGPGFCSGLVNHWHREPDHQVIWCILQVRLNPRFPRRHPVL